MAKRTKRVPVECESTLEGAVSDAMTEVQALRDEIVEWRDNMDGNNMSHLPKYEEVNECAEALDQHADSPPEIPSDFPEGLDDLVKWTEPMEKRRGRATRSERCSQAVAALRAVQEAVEEFLEGHPEGHKCWDDDADRSAWEQAVDQLEEVVECLDGVSFPGMY